MAVIKVSDLPQKATLDSDDKIVGYSSTGGTSLLLGSAFKAIQTVAETAASNAAASESTVASEKSELESEIATAKTDISTAKMDAVSAITTAQTTATDAIASAKTTAVSAVNSAKSTALSDVSAQQTTSVTAVKSQGDTSVAAVQSAQITATDAITTAHTTAISAVQAQEAASIQAIEADSVLAGYAKATDVAATYLPLTGGTMSLGSETGIKFNGQAQICSYMDGAVCIRNLKDPTMPKIYMGNLGSGGGTLSYTNPGDYFAFSAAVKAPSFQATSDARKKTGLTPVHPDLSGLTAYRYTLKDDGKTHVGLVAQEVEKVIPEAVSEDKEGFLALDYNAVVAALVDEVNQLKARVAELER